eukprot:3940411-Rhodomonas_salina.1
MGNGGFGTLEWTLNATAFAVSRERSVAVSRNQMQKLRSEYPLHCGMCLIPLSSQDREMMTKVVEPVTSPSCLRACYAMSGTGATWRSICLRTCYALSGTECLYGADVPVCTG